MIPSITVANFVSFSQKLFSHPPQNGAKGNINVAVGGGQVQLEVDLSLVSATQIIQLHYTNHSDMASGPIKARGWSLTLKYFLTEVFFGLSRVSCCCKWKVNLPFTVASFL